MRYYFDIRDEDNFARDDIGVDLRDDRAARLQATLALTEMRVTIFLPMETTATCP